jgi:hypothetical protein
MGFRNLNTQEKIKRDPRNIVPLVLNVRTEYYTACPNPIVFDIEVVSGNYKEHQYEWTIIDGSLGKFKPNHRTLNAVFDPLGTKERRIVQLIVDKDTEVEQQYICYLYDKATSFPEGILDESSSIFPFTNEPSRAVSVVDMNFVIDDLGLFNQDLTQLEFGSYGNIQYVNQEVWKVEIFSYPDMTLIETVYYPSTTVHAIQGGQRYFVKTWYKYDRLPPIYACNLLTVINVPTSVNLRALIVEDRIDFIRVNSSGAISYNYLGNGASIVQYVENVDLYLNYASSKRFIYGMKWIEPWEEEDQEQSLIGKKAEELEAANNSPRLQIKSSGSSIITLLDYKSGVIG